MAGSVISTARARRIASDWHGGQTSGLYSLASWSGIVPDDTVVRAAREVDREIDDLDGLAVPLGNSSRHELQQLQRYLAAEAKRRGLDL